ncbi:four helix bundle protein [Luteolibacter pohnpeiensis]|uniref:Four helix bundle protein n=1 Tax=Luteolibacter pohnpeiensis TaxID=454153 RepID=A0A934S905_9BACT|nr:four helix bundle protein [Luteolibacter pohnpeiensis]
MDPEPTKTFEDLEAWKSGREFRIFVFRNILPILTKAREYDLGDQLKRSSRSVTHNIAEGHGRFHFLDNYRFCSQARGSLNEVLDQIITCHDDSLISNDLYESGRDHFNKTLRILNGYMSWLKRSAQQQAPKKPLN